MMKAFMTNGTFDFLKKLVATHPKINFFFMSGGTSTLAYYESEGKKKGIFAAGRAYEAILVNGDIQKSGYVVMNNIPVTDEGRPVFEDRFKQRQGDIDSMPGFQAFRLLRPVKGSTYVVLTQWASKKDFETWKNSKAFKQSHKSQPLKPPAYYADKPFVTSYSMINKEDV